MIKLAGIIVLDGQPTEAGLDLCKLVYEQVTGKCWHEYPVCLICDKCKKTWWPSEPNPALLTDLNAIHELEVAYREKHPNRCLANAICTIFEGWTVTDAVTAPAHLRLQSLAMCLEADCDNGFILVDCECVKAHLSRAHAEKYGCSRCFDGKQSEVCPHCKDGRTTVFDNWTRKWEGNDAD